MRGTVRVTTFVILLMGAASNLPAPDRCSGSDVNCGMKCINWGVYDGYCNPPAPETSGCIMLTSGCASIQYVECCDPNAGGGQF